MLLLLKHVNRQLFEPALCLFSGEGPFRSQLPADVPLTVLDKRGRWDALRLVHELAVLLRRLEPDVVFSKLSYANVITAAAVWRARSRTPFVVGEDSIESVELARLRHARLRRMLLRWAYRRATGIVVPSQGVADDLAQNLRIVGRSTRTIPNMAEMGLIREATSQSRSANPFAASSHPLVVCLGRLEEPKGQAELIAAIELLNAERPVNLALMGEGEDEERLRAMTVRMGVEKRVAFLGFVADPFALMAEADVVVSPSHWESFGNTIIEAMAVGVPVVSTRVRTGPEEIIRDGENGLFANPRDPRDLAEKIRKVLNDEDLARRLASSATIAAKSYDTSAVVPQYESYLRIAAAAPAA